MPRSLFFYATNDLAGNKVFIEVKAKPMNPSEVHKLCGQVSTYYNAIKSADQNARFFIVVMKDNNSDHNYKIWNGLKHWLNGEKVKIFQFEIVNNGNYCFSSVAYKTTLCL